MPLLPLFIVSLIALVAEQAWRLPVGDGSTVAWTWIVVVFVAMRGPAQGAKWLALLLGAAVDLSTPYPLADHAAVLGPHALAYLAGAWAVVRWRDWFQREAILALMVLVFAAGLVAHTVEALLLLVRSLPFLEGHYLTGRTLPRELWHRLASLAAVTIASAPAGWLLERLLRSRR